MIKSIIVVHSHAFQLFFCLPTQDEDVYPLQHYGEDLLHMDLVMYPTSTDVRI